MTSTTNKSIGVETDMTAFFSVVNTIGLVCKNMKKIIVEKSTVPVGTAYKTRKIL